MDKLPDPEFASILSEAYTLRRHRRFEDAWQCLESLSSSDLKEPEALAVRIQLCADLERWALGGRLVSMLAATGGETHNVTCAEFLVAYARFLVADGNLELARDSLENAVELWPPLRVEIDSDSAFADL